MADFEQELSKLMGQFAPQGGFGIQTAPALSELAATLITGGEHPLARQIRPERFRQAG